MSSTNILLRLLRQLLSCLHDKQPQSQPSSTRSTIRYRREAIDRIGYLIRVDVPSSPAYTERQAPRDKKRKERTLSRCHLFALGGSSLD
mmetsp:Transcript_17743/g.38819  ORF Transcript_17743/g.38819 Transcript_17743/m.38819 type:complete len:89 (-) Transcript_17743:43-309(-)